jgi:hypothetical protein
MRVLGVVVSLWLCFLGPTACFGITLEIDVPCQPLEECDVLLEAHLAKDAPLFRWQGYHHAAIHLPDLISHEVAREVGLYFLGAIGKKQKITYPDLAI